MREPLVTAAAAWPKGPYSQGIVTRGNLVFVAGQGPVDPVTGEFRLGSFEEQAELTFQNIGAVLAAAGASFEHVVKVSAFLADYGDFAAFNSIYQRHFKEPYPVRTTVQAGLGQISIELDCIAVLPEGG